MTLDEYFQVGETVDLGAYTFEPAAIVAFATSFDPQPFHLSEEQAKGSVFGALCASGWHTAAAWMQCFVRSGLLQGTHIWSGQGPAPSVGASPGFKSLRWLKPVFAGETVRYTRRITGHRPLATRPGYRIVTLWAEGHDSQGDKVIEFENAIVVKVA